MTRIVARFALTALALAGIAATVWPSGFRGSELWNFLEWPWRAYVAIGNAAAIGAGVLALLLAWKSGHRAGTTLAAALGFAALAFGAGTNPSLPWDVPLGALRAVTLGSAVLAVTGLATFAGRWPRPYRPGLRLEEVLRSERATTPLGRFGTAVGRGVSALVPVPRAARRAAGRYRAWRDGLVARSRTEEGSRRVEALRDGLLLSLAERGWRVGAVAAALLATLAVVSPETLMPLALILFFGYPVLGAWLLLRVGWALGTDEERRQVLWVVEGFTLLIMVPGLLSWAFIISVALGDASMLALGSLWAAAGALGGACLVACLGVAVFGAGALDPEATLRRTVAYGALSLVLTLVFAGMENAASGWVVAAIGLPGTAAVWVSSGVTALAFGALHRRIDRATERALRQKPQTTTAPAPEL